VLKSTSQAKIAARSIASWSSSPAAVTVANRLDSITPDTVATRVSKAPVTISASRASPRRETRRVRTSSIP